MVSQVGSVFEAIKKPLEDKPSNQKFKKLNMVLIKSRG